MVWVQRAEQKQYQARQAALQAENQKVKERGLAPGSVQFDGKGSTLSEKDYQAHLLGTVSIPRINVAIPLFDTTDDSLLQVGATVVQGTSYPTGGANTHAVIAAHSGLPDRELFTNLEEVKVGDEFVLTVLGEKLAYQVETIRVVKPDDTSSLQIEANRDLVTLLTCTPYMINTDRLLVTGHRVPYTAKLAKQVQKSAAKSKTKEAAILIGTGLFILVALGIMGRLLFLYFLRRKRFDLPVVLVDEEGQPLVGMTIVLYQRKGKQPLKRQGQPFQLVSDEAGRVVFTALPRDRYMLKYRQAESVQAVGVVGFKQLKQSKLAIYRQMGDYELTVNDEATVVVRFI